MPDYAADEFIVVSLAMADTHIERLARRRYRAYAQRLADDLERLRLDRGLSQRALAAAAGIAQSEISRFESGRRVPPMATVFAIATALGVEPSLRFFEVPGPRIVDRTQALITEALLRIAHPRWTDHPEVGVSRPVRGVIDHVLVNRGGDVVVTEIQGELRRAEQQVRWAGEKADAIASATGWPWEARSPTRVHRLLVLRSTQATRSVVRSLPGFYAAAYPAPASAAYDALTGVDAAWPGNAILWADVDGERTRILRGLPRDLR